MNKKFIQYIGDLKTKCANLIVKDILFYTFFGVTYIFNVVMFYFFCLRAWRIKDVINYTDNNYKGYLDMVELYFGYISGWTILYIISCICSLCYIKNNKLLSVLWLLIPVLYMAFFIGHQYQ